jgi:RecA-family ATPase
MHLTYSEGHGSLGHAKALVTVEGESGSIIANVIARLNSDRTARENRWLSPNVWKGDHRTSANWLSACGFPGDFDWGHYEVSTVENGRPKRKFVKAPLPPEVAQAIEAEANALKLPGNAYHLSPHGLRTIGILGEQCHDRVAFAAAAQVYEEDLARWLAGHPEWTPVEGKDGFKLDPTVTKDLARYLWSPCSKVWSREDGQFHERAAEVVLMRDEPLDLQDMVRHAAAARTGAADTGPRPGTPPHAGKPREHAVTVKEAVERFCIDWEKANRRIDQYLTAGGKHAPHQCPMCGHRECFNLLPRQQSAKYDRWCCHSASHDGDAGHHHGRASEDGARYTGDALDLTLALDDLHEDVETSIARIRLLQERGYLPAHIDVEPANEPTNPFFECAVSFTADRLRRDPPRQEYIWEYRIPRGSRIAGSVSAAGGTGKTSLLVGLGLARAQGKDYLGIKTRPGRTVFISAEEKAEDYERKLKAWSLNDLSFDYEAVARHLLVIDVVGKGLKLATVERGRYQTNQQDVRRLAEVIRARAPGADLVVLETASRLGPDETNEGHAALVTACEELSGLVNATVLVVGHVSKAAARERSGDAYVGRGGSSLTDNGRFSLTLTRFPTDAGAQKREVGRVVPDAIAERLLVFKSPKVNAAKPQPAVVLECIGKEDWGLTVAPFDIESVAANDALDRLYQEQQNEDVEKLWMFLTSATAAGERHSANTLKEQCSRVGIARSEMEEVVEQAKALGRVIDGPTMPKGRLPQLLPVPEADWPQAANEPASDQRSA